MGGVRKIAFHVPSKIEPRPPDVSTIISTTTINVSPQLPGKSSHDEQEEFEEEKAEEEEEEEEERFISSEELAQNRLSDRGVVDVACHLLLIYSLHSSFPPPSVRPPEMQEMSVFRGYSPGEPSLRLYIKNLSRQTTEQVHTSITYVRSLRHKPSRCLLYIYTALFVYFSSLPVPHVPTQDLRYVYGRYINWSSERQKTV